MRLIAIIMSTIIGASPKDYYTVQPCYVLDHIYRGNQTKVQGLYPGCSTFYSGADPEQHVPVPVGAIADGPERFASSINTSFGPSAYLALAIHTIACELYLRLTPAESERLRRVSYQRQKEAGMKNPGNAGLTAQRLGDAEPWNPDPPKTKSTSIMDDEDISTTGYHNLTERLSARVHDPERDGQ